MGISCSLDLAELGLREAKNQVDLQGFRPIKGTGAVGANLATLRMLARCYGTPCAVDVIEKVLEGQVNEITNTDSYNRTAS